MPKPKFPSKYKVLLKGMLHPVLSSRLYWRGIAVFLLSSLTFYYAVAADQHPYRVDLSSTGNSDIDKTLSDTSNLVALEKIKAVGAFALAGRVKGDYERLQKVMDSFGYYDAKIKIQVVSSEAKETGKHTDKKHNDKQTIFLQPVGKVANLQSAMDGNDTNLPNYIEHIPNKKDAIMVIHIDKGEQYKIGSVELKGGKGQKDIHLTTEQEKSFQLHVGQAAISADIAGAQGRLLAALQEGGHALAKVSEPVAYLRPESKTLAIVYTVQPGPVVDLGDIDFAGLKKVNASYVRKRLLLHEGQLFQPSKIESARQDLSSIGVFSSIDVHAADKLDANGHLPLTLQFKESKPRTISAEAGYSTDLGGRIGLRWSHHNLLGNAEQLKVVVLATGLGGSAQRGLGYDIYADFSKPDFGHRNQNFNARVEGVKQNLYSYNQTALLVKAGIDRKLNNRWSVSADLGGIQEKIIQDHVANNYTMINIPLAASYDNTDLASPLMSPTRGMKASVSMTPTESFGGGTVFFTIMQATGSTYFDLTHFGISDPGRSIFAFRGAVGSVQGASLMRLPPDQRLYAGGAATVRGFRFQGVGPQFKGTKYAKGGTAMDTGSIEFRQRILSQFGMQTFIDAGQVSENGAPFSGKLRVGAGAGGKYYTPLGPIRFDVAVPLNRPPRGDKFEVYIGLGETF